MNGISMCRDEDYHIFLVSTIIQKLKHKYIETIIRNYKIEMAFFKSP
jgi:hypothetical protein